MGALKPWQHLNIGCVLDSDSFLLKPMGHLKPIRPRNH